MDHRIVDKSKTVKPQADTPIVKAVSSTAEPTHPLLQLQQSMGNRALGRFMQASLQSGLPADEHEQQANTIADQVLPGSKPQPASISPVAEPSVQRQPAGPAAENTEGPEPLLGEEIVVVASQQPEVGGIENSEAGEQSSAGPKPTPQEASAKQEETPADLNLPPDRLRQAATAIGNYLQSAMDKRAEQAEALKKVPEATDPKQVTVTVTLPIDESLLQYRDINRVLAIRAFRTAFEGYGISLDFGMAERIHDRSGWTPYKSDENVRALITKRLQKGESTVKYHGRGLPSLVKLYEQIRVEDKARYEKIITELHKIHYAEDAVKSFYIAHFNGIASVINGIPQLLLAPHNLIQAVRGKEGIHFEPIPKIDYPGEYGKKYGGSMETGVMIGLMVTPTGALGESVGAGTTWLSRLVTGIKPGGLPVGTTIVKVIQGALTAGVVSAAALAGRNMAQTYETLRSGVKVMPDGTTEKLTDDDAGKLLESVIMDALMIAGGVKAVQHLGTSIKEATEKPPEGTSETKPPESKPPEGTSEAKPPEGTQEAKPPEATEAQPPPTLEAEAQKVAPPPEPQQAAPPEAGKTEVGKEAAIKEAEAKGAAEARPEEVAQAPEPAPTEAPPAEARPAEALTEAQPEAPPAKKPGAKAQPKKPKAAKAAASPSEVAPAEASPAAAKSARTRKKSKAAETAEAKEPAAKEPSGPTPLERMESLKQARAKLLEEQKKNTAERDALEAVEKEKAAAYKQANIKAEAAAKARAKPEVQEQLEAAKEEASADLDEARAARREAEEKVSAKSRELDRVEADIDRTLIALDPAKYRAVLPCFSGDTPVWTDNGPRPIDQLRAGDLVLAFDLARLEVVRRAIKEVLRNSTLHFYDIDLGESIIHATGQHRFWVESQADWIAARDLRPGMLLSSLNGSSVPVKAVAFREDLESATYNLSVERTPNYFVGQGVLVHNGGEIDIKLGGKYIIYRARHTGDNPEFKDKTYIGQTTEESMFGKSAGKPRGIEAREGEHVAKALKELAQHDAGLKELSEKDLKFYEFMSEAKLEMVVVGAETSIQADYLEQQNIKAEREQFGADNVMNRREQIKSETHMKDVKAKIVEGLAAKGLPCPP
jgi:hypothetical protein